MPCEGRRAGHILGTFLLGFHFLALSSTIHRKNELQGKRCRAERAGCVAAWGTLLSAGLCAPNTAAVWAVVSGELLPLHPVPGWKGSRLRTGCIRVPEAGSWSLG